MEVTITVCDFWFYDKPCLTMQIEVGFDRYPKPGIEIGDILDTGCAIGCNRIDNRDQRKGDCP